MSLLNLRWFSLAAPNQSLVHSAGPRARTPTRQPYRAITVSDHRLIETDYTRFVSTQVKTTSFGGRSKPHHPFQARARLIICA